VPALRRPVLFLPWLLITLALPGCDFGATIGDIVTGGTATHLTAVTLFQAPPIPGTQVAPVTVVRLFFGTRPIGDVGFHALNGASVAIVDGATGPTASADPSGHGLYVSSSASGGVSYDVGATYTFTITNSDGEFIATGLAPPPEDVPQFQNPQPVGVGQDYHLMRNTQPDQSGQLPIAFVTVASVANPQQPTWTNAPSTANGLLQLAIDDSIWRVPSIDIPGTAFPVAGAYVITLTAVERGSVVGHRLFSGSTVLIGSGVAGLVGAL
jgi:hypothetical protein